MQGFTFFRPEAVQDCVIFQDLSHILREEGIECAVARIAALLREHEARYAVIDSFKALRAFCSEDDFRRALQELAAVATSLPLTFFWVGEYGENDTHHLPEFAVADSVIELVLNKVGTRDNRYLRVLKMRGSGFLGGEHSYRISPQGLLVFPRLVSPTSSPDYETVGERTLTGVEVLDEMVAEGLWRGSSTVVFGPPGSGKTLLGLHFIFKGMEMGEKGLILSMQENPIQLARIAAGFGWDIAAAIDSGQLRITYVSPVEVSIDEVLYNLTRELDEFSPQRVVIDSLNDLEAAAGDLVRFHDLTYALVQSMVVRGVTLFLTAEIPDLFGTSYLSQFGVSHISDNVILLHYLREESEVKRAITVLKTRGSQHDTAIRQFSIDQTGLHIAGGFSQGTVFAR